MCGRFTLRIGRRQLAEEFDIPEDEVPEIPPRFNIAPTDTVMMVRRSEEGGGRECVGARWGLVPFWVDDPSDWPTLINARSETAPDKPSFRDAFRRRRCLVPADGFYEWLDTGGPKQPYYVRLDEDRVFGFAGLWERWAGESGDPLVSCTILTTEPNDVVRRVHDRMPVIIPRERYREWLGPSAHDGDPRELLRPYPPGELIAYPVSRSVNDPSYDHPDCIRPQEG